MSPATIAPPAAPVVTPRRTVADMLRELGDIPAHRVRMHPYPGTATETDAIRLMNSERTCELINGTLVEKPMGVPQGYLGSLVAFFLNSFVLPRRLGIVIQPDALFRMLPGNLREPDVSFTQKARLPNPLPQVGGWCPDLCVEILSPDNTVAEMKQKRVEYFRSGCGLVWEFDVETRTVKVYSDVEVFHTLSESDTVDGGSVIPGFTLPLTQLFSAYDDGLRQ